MKHAHTQQATENLSN